MSPDPGKNVPKETGPIAIVEGEVYPDRVRSSHRFIGPDYALIDDFPYPDDLEASARAQEEQLLQIDRLLKNAVHIRSLEAESSHQLLEIHLDVESLINGHRVPTGFTSERQLWISLQVYNMQNELLFQTGGLDANGDLLDSHSAFVRDGSIAQDQYLVNFQSKNWVVSRQYSENGALLPQHDGRTEYETIFPFDADNIERHSLKPLETRRLDFNITVSETGPYRIVATLRYRNLPPYMLRALHLDALVPRLKIFDIDSEELIVQ